MDTLKALIGINTNYIIIVLMAVFFTAEQLISVQFNFKQRRQHLFNNVLFLAAFFILNFFWSFVVVFIIEQLNRREIGLLYLIEIPYWIKLIAGVVLLDFVTYWFHRAAHIFPFVWRFHRVHHSDTSLDASSNFRGHPLETIFWFGIANLVTVAIFGLDTYALGLYFLLVTPLFFLEHSNIRFPKWLDKSVGLVFTTPNIHKIHHDQDQHYTDSNFADIFILWDRLFGTFTYKPPEQIVFGLKEFDEERKQSFWYQMICPFINVERVKTVETGTIVSESKKEVV